MKQSENEVTGFLAFSIRDSSGILRRRYSEKPGPGTGDGIGLLKRF